MSYGIGHLFVEGDEPWFPGFLCERLIDCRCAIAWYIVLI